VESSAANPRATDRAAAGRPADADFSSFGAREALDTPRALVLQDAARQHAASTIGGADVRHPIERKRFCSEPAHSGHTRGVGCGSVARQCGQRRAF
jgi:hypothetical protein